MHGLGVDGRMWFLQEPGLSVEYHVFALTLPGFGGLEPIFSPPGRVLDSYGDWIAEKIRSFGLGKVTLVGYSMGGTLALNVALRYPELVGKLGLLCTSSCWGEGWRGKSSWLLKGVVGRLVAEFLQFNAGLSLKKLVSGTEALELVEDMLALADRPTMVKILYELMTTDMRGELGKITVPTLVVAGGKDFIAPGRYWRALMAGLPNAEFHLVGGADHFLCASHPGWLTTRLMQFAQPAPAVERED